MVNEQVVGLNSLPCGKRPHKSGIAYEFNDNSGLISTCL